MKSIKLNHRQCQYLDHLNLKNIWVAEWDFETHKLRIEEMKNNFRQYPDLLKRCYDLNVFDTLLVNSNAENYKKEFRIFVDKNNRVRIKLIKNYYEGNHLKLKINYA